MGYIRRSTGLGLDGSSTSAAPVSDPGTIRLRSNAAGTAIEVSYNGAAYTTFSGGGGPAGTGTELQYRNGAAFGAVAGSAVASTGVDIVNTQTTPTTSTTYYGFKGAAVNATTSTIASVTYYGVHADVSSTTTNSQPAELIGLRSTVTHNVASTIGTAIGLDTTVTVTGTGSTMATTVAGVQASLVLSQKAITTAYGLLFGLSGGLTGSIGTAYGASISINNGLMPVTTAYGLRITISEGAAITNKYALVTTSGSGNVGINTITPTAQLHVAGTGLFTGQVQFTPTATLAGLNVGSWPANPSAPVNGDIWYQSTANELVARINGTNVALGVAATTPRLDQVLDPTASKTFAMSAGGTDYTLRYLWDTATGTNNLFTIENGAADSGTGAALLLKIFGTKTALVVNNGADVFTLTGGSVDMTGLLTVRDSAGLGIRIFDGATNNVYLQYVGATPALRLHFNGGPAITVATVSDTQTLTNKTLHTSTSVTASISWGDGVKQTFNPDATNAGINVGSVAGDPSAPANGDLWYDSTANELTARINGANVALGAGGGGSPGGSGSEIQYRSGASTFGAVTGSSVSGATITLAGALTVTQDSATLGVVSNHFVGSASGGGVSVVKGRGTAASPTAVLANDVLGAYTFAGQYSSTIGQTTISGGVYAEAVSNFTATNAAETDITIRCKPAGSSAVHIGLRVTSDSRVGIGDEITHAQVTDRLTVIGNTLSTNTITTPVASTTYYGVKGQIVNASSAGAAGSVKYYGMLADASSTTTNEAPNELKGIVANVTQSVGAGAGSLTGIEANIGASTGGTGNVVASVFGINAQATLSSKTYTNVYGMNFNLNGGLSGVIGTAYGCNIGINNGLMTVTTAYGLRVTITEGAAITNKYALVVDSGSGNSGFGTATPGAMLHTISDATGKVGAIIQTAASSTADALRINANTTTKVKFTTNASGDMNSVFGSAALSTSATDGFIFLPTCAGTPSGTPSTFTGMLPIVIDSTAKKIWINFTGTGWLSVALA